MSTGPAGVRPSRLRHIRLPAAGIRFRLAVLHSILLFGVAALAVGAIYQNVSRVLEDEPMSRHSAFTELVDTPIFGSSSTTLDNAGGGLQVFEEAVNRRALRQLRIYSVVALAVDEPSETLVSLCAGGEMRTWDLATLNLVQTIAPAEPYLGISAIAFNTQHAALVTGTRRPVVWQQLRAGATKEELAATMLAPHGHRSPLVAVLYGGEVPRPDADALPGAEHADRQFRTSSVHLLSCLATTGEMSTCLRTSRRRPPVRPPEARNPSRQEPSSPLRV